MIRVICPAIAVLVISLVSGCASTHKVNVEPRLDALPSTTKSPVHAGVYYSPHFANQEQSRTSGSNTWVVSIGAASVRLFEDVFPRVFEKTSRISTLSVDEFSAKGIDVVIAPSLEHFDFMIGLDADSDRYSVVYRMTLYTNRGVPVASWIVSGNKPSKSFGIWGPIEDDMTDAAVKFLQSLERNAGPALSAIAKSKTRNAVPVDLTSVVLTAKRADLPGLDPKVETALREAGLVTVRLSAHSATARGLVVRASDTRLRLKDGQILEPATVSSVLSALDQTSQAGGAAAAFTGGLVGILVMGAEQRSRQEEREVQSGTVGRSLFLDRMLTKGKEEAGMVPFLIPKGKAVTEGMVLTVWLVDPNTAEGAQAEIPLHMAQ